MAKRKAHHEEHVDESWLIPYADILTLLLALFIVLFAVSTTDAEKLKQMADSMNSAFNGGLGVLEETSPVEMPAERVELPEEASFTEESEENTFTAEMEDLGVVQEKIDAYIVDKGLSKSLTTTLTEDGLMITFLDHALFASGSAVVKGSGIPLAREISNLIYTETPRRITVSGHTDTVPIGNSGFRSNWDLSAMRALNFMRILLENEKLDPANFVASGYGEYHPVASNDTVEGKQKNRRVEVLIKPNFTKYED